MSFTKYVVGLYVAANFWSGSVTACTIGETAAISLPFNTMALSNADRIAIADKIIEAKKWPDVGIQAVVIAGAYVQEKNVEKLKDGRAMSVSEYLLKLGIDSGNIYVDKKTLTDAMASKRPDGSIDIQQVIVEFTPICKGSCAWMCDDPRVTPHSRLIKSD